eukprot:scaffold22650_cov95-Cylindrotheca_fusiformis.AAC.1
MSSANSNMGPSPAPQAFSLDSDTEKPRNNMAPHLSVVEDADEELRLAKEMAMAIAKNPHLTPAELRQLQDRSSTTKKKPTTETTTNTHATTANSAAAAAIPAATTNKAKSTFSSTISPATSKDVFRKVNDKAKSLKNSLTKSLSGSSGHNGPKRELMVTKSDPLPAVPIAPNLSMESTYSESSIEEATEEAVKKRKKKQQNQIRLNGIVWKRRSGLGKYSSTSAWERRRIVLKGTRLVYYKNIHHNSEEEDDSSVDSHGLSHQDSDSSAIAAPPANHTKTSSGNWLESMSKQVTDVAANFGVSTTVSGDDAARGHLDLIKENASVSAAFGHSGAPTPFALSVKVLTQTKWKLCFDTQAELMQWLSVLTDVIVQASVDSYNSSILLANDPKHAGDSHGQLSEPPMRTGEATETAGGHRLWSTGHYKIKSDNFPDYLEHIDEAELQDYEEDMADEDNQYREATSDPLELMLDQNSGTPVYCVTEDFLLPFCMLVNSAILISRASATSVEAFWYILVFTNMAIFVFVQKDRIGMQVQKPVITSKMARRLSSVMGMKILPTVREEEPAKQPKLEKRTASERMKLPKKFKPLAGSTAMKIENPTDPPVNKDGHVFAGWMPGDPSQVQVRSHGYKSTKAKIPSPGSLYTCSHMDIFEGTKRYPDMASRVELQKVSFPDDPEVKTWNAPDTFIVSVSLPTDPPRLYATVEDGGGYTIVMYFTMNQDTRDILKRVTANGYNAVTDEPPVSDIQKSKVNAVRLFEEWCRLAPTDNSWMARFKCVPQGHNFEEIGLPAWISKYNGKPFLIKRPGQTGFLFRHPEVSCMEFDVSFYPFPYLAKQGICRSDDELPECLIGLTTLCYPDPNHALKAEDIFA